MLFVTAFADVSDPRQFNSQHDLTEILFIAMSAILCGAKSCMEFAQFGQSRHDLLREVLPLENGIPSHDTFSRVLRLLDPAELNAGFARFMAAFGAEVGLDAPKGVVAIDGKSLRGAYDKGRAHMPKLVVSAYACDTFMTLTQVVADGGDERAAAIAVVKWLSLKGCTVTGDALHCNRPLTQAVRDAGGDYALCIKANQSKLMIDAAAALDAADPKTPTYETVGRAHGREELRRAVVVPFDTNPGRHPLVDLRAVARVEAWRTIDGKTTHKVRHYALSRVMAPDELMETVRNHWRIENNLHWTLDMRFSEDNARNRKDNGPANLAALRRLALNIHRAHPTKGSINIKMQRAAWEPRFLFELLTHMR
jgi:predicted transposase YbfD/YdcC